MIWFSQVLPQAVVVGETISNTVPLPRSESSHENLLHRLATATQTQRTLKVDVYTQAKIYNDTNNTLSAGGLSYVHRINADDIFIRQLDDDGEWISDTQGVSSGIIVIWSGSVVFQMVGIYAMGITRQPYYALCFIMKA